MKIKKYCVLIIFFLFVVSPLSFAGETVSSQIQEVTLFSRQALVKRKAVVKVHKGLNELFLDVDAFRVDRDSVSAKVFGKGEIFSVQFKEIYLKESPQENISTLEKKIEELKKSKKTLSDEKKVLNKKETFLQSLIDFSQTQVPQDIKTNFPKIEDLNKTLTFLASNFQNINHKKQILDSGIEDIEKEIKVLEQELVSLQRSRKKTKKVIELLFNSSKEQKIRIEANYLTRNAFWRPLYKVSVPLTLEEVDLTMFSKIWQKTGEDWDKIALSISNVIPLRGIGLPSPSRWLLDIQRPREKVMRKAGRVALDKAAPAHSMQALQEEADFEGVPEEEAAFTHARKKELPLSFEYKIPQALDIESRDKETILPLFARKLQGEFFYYAVPRRSTLTFLICKANAAKEFLSGPLNVYFGGRFIGTTFLREKKAGEDFRLNLGADREIKVKREKIKDKIKETFFGKIERDTIIRELAFKITLESLKKKPIKLRLLDAIPVSGTDKVEVKDIKIIPQPTEKDYQNKEGVMLWEYKLKPGEKQEIDIAFVVTYPKNLPLLGL